MPARNCLLRWPLISTELVMAGALLDCSDLQPSSSCQRIRYDKYGHTLTDGLFTEIKELIARTP